MLDLQGFGHLLISGSVVTIKLAVTSLFFGMVLGLLGASAKLSSVTILRRLATVYTTVMRGIPELLLIMFLYFGSIILLNGMFEFLNTKFGLGINIRVNISAFWAGVLALSIAFGAYATEILRMAIQEIPKGQWESAKAIGMKPIMAFFYIILPQVWSLALPGLGNLFLVLIKDTALISLIGLKDLMYFAKRGGESTKEQFTFYMTAALIYLAMTVIVTAIMMWLEWLSDPAKRYSNRLKKQQINTQKI